MHDFLLRVFTEREIILNDKENKGNYFEPVKALYQNKCLGLKSIIFLCILEPTKIEIRYLSPPDLHPRPYSHRIIQVGKEAWMSIVQHWVSSEVRLVFSWLYPVQSSKPPRMKTAQPLWAHWSPLLSCPHGEEAFS